MRYSLSRPMIAFAPRNDQRQPFQATRRVTLKWTAMIARRLYGEIQTGRIEENAARAPHPGPDSVLDPDRRGVRIHILAVLRAHQIGEVNS
jgi:hypothetical protein